MDQTTPTWGYMPDGSAQIFHLAAGEGLPDGWHPSPDCIADPALATAEALSARVEGRPFAVLVVDDASGRQADASIGGDLLANAMAEIDRLTDIIATGSGENQRLFEDLDAAEAARDAAIAEAATARAAHEQTMTALEAASDALDDLKAQLTQAQADGGFAVSERDAALADLDALKADLAQARADLDAATAPAAPKPAKAR